MFDRKIKTKNLYLAELVKVEWKRNHKVCYHSLKPKKYALVRKNTKEEYKYKDVLNKSVYFLCNSYLSYEGAIAIDDLRPACLSKNKVKYSDAERMIEYLNNGISK